MSISFLGQVSGLRIPAEEGLPPSSKDRFPACPRCGRQASESGPAARPDDSGESSVPEPGASPPVSPRRPRGEKGGREPGPGV